MTYSFSDQIVLVAFKKSDAKNVFTGALGNVGFLNQKI